MLNTQIIPLGYAAFCVINFILNEWEIVTNKLTETANFGNPQILWMPTYGRTEGQTDRQPNQHDQNMASFSGGDISAAQERIPVIFTESDTTHGTDKIKMESNIKPLPLARLIKCAIYSSPSVRCSLI